MLRYFFWLSIFIQFVYFIFVFFSSFFYFFIQNRIIFNLKEFLPNWIETFHCHFNDIKLFVRFVTSGNWRFSENIHIIRAYLETCFFHTNIITWIASIIVVLSLNYALCEHIFFFLSIQNIIHTQTHTHTPCIRVLYFRVLTHVYFGTLYVLLKTFCKFSFKNNRICFLKQNASLRK